MSSGIERKSEMSKVLKQMIEEDTTWVSKWKTVQSEKAMNISRMLREQQGGQSGVARVNKNISKKEVES